MTSGRRSAVFVSLLTAAALCVTLPAPAQYRQRVLVLEQARGDEQDREITTRIRAELAAAGFDVLLLEAPEKVPKLAVEETGHELRAASVLLVVQSEPQGSIELWLADRLLGKTVVLRLKPDTSPPDEESAARSRNAARVAVQAVELVKAQLAELSLTRERRREQTPSPVTLPPPATEARRAQPNLTAALGRLEGFQAGRQALTPVLRFGVALPQGWLGDAMALDVRGTFIGLGGAAHVRAEKGSASVRHSAATLDIVTRFLPRRGVQPFVSLGGGVLALDVAGEAAPPYSNEAARTISGLFATSCGIWLKPMPNFGLVLEAQLLSAWSKTVVRIAGEEASDVAAPLALGSAGLMLEFQ